MTGRLLCRLGLHAWEHDHFGGNPAQPVRRCQRSTCDAIRWGVR